MSVGLYYNIDIVGPRHYKVEIGCRSMIKAALPFGLLVEIFIRYILINRTVSPDPVEVGTVVIFLNAEEGLSMQPRDDVVFGKTATKVTLRGSDIAAAKRPKQRSTVQVGKLYSTKTTTMLCVPSLKRWLTCLGRE
jgi:hypothetical protein